VVVLGVVQQESENLTWRLHISDEEYTEYHRSQVPFEYDGGTMIPSLFSRKTVVVVVSCCCQRHDIVEQSFDLYQRDEYLWAAS
jgi:hypothetical protein